MEELDKARAAPAEASEGGSWDDSDSENGEKQDVLGQMAEAGGRGGGRGGGRFGARSAKSEVQESWDSLTKFRRHNRARLDGPRERPEADTVQKSPEQQQAIETAVARADDLAGYIDELDTLVAGMPEEQAVSDHAEQDFAISCLPTGQTLTLDIKTTWGDRYYVGLCGLELFDGDGEKIARSALKHVGASPAGMNDLPDYTNDPRTVDNLFDGVNRTCDAFHLWLAPFTPGSAHTITVEFARATTLSMIRVWNYNESRTSVSRGARHVEICVDENPVFRGEIRQAPGVLDGSEDDAECIFLTTDASLLKAIEIAVQAESESARKEIEVDVEITRTARPSTSGTRRAAGPSEVKPEGSMPPPLRDTTQQHKKAEDAGVLEAELALPKEPRPPVSKLAPTAVEATVVSVSHAVPAPTQPKPALKPKRSDTRAVVAAGCRRCQKVVIRLFSTWGDPHYVGLGGLELIDENGNPVAASSIAELTANPRDLHSTPGYEGGAYPACSHSRPFSLDCRLSADLRRLENLISTERGSTNDATMWLAPFSGSPHKRNGSNVVEITFTEETSVSAIRVWNYNKDWESSFRGARLARIEVDGVPIQSSTVLRKVSSFRTLRARTR